MRHHNLGNHINDNWDSSCEISFRPKRLSRKDFDALFLELTIKLRYIHTDWDFMQEISFWNMDKQEDTYNSLYNQNCKCISFTLYDQATRNVQHVKSRQLECTLVIWFETINTVYCKKYSKRRLMEGTAVVGTQVMLAIANVLAGQVTEEEESVSCACSFSKIRIENVRNMFFRRI